MQLRHLSAIASPEAICIGRVTSTLIVGLALLCCACSQPDPPAGDGEAGGAAPRAEVRPLLTEITAQVGLADLEPPLPDGTYFILEIMGPGVGVFDYDGDGDLDILQLRLPFPGRWYDPAPNRLFAQQHDGTFRDVSQAAGLADPGYAQAVAIGDVDNDGDRDVYFANWGADSFYLNDGNGTFSNATSAAGFDDDRWSSSATLCDYDRDGDLDLYVAHYVDTDYIGGCRTNAGVPDYCGPATYDGEPDRLYRNEGNGTFSDVTTTAGIVTANNGERAKGLGVVCVDLTGDGWPDFYVANDGEPNQFWVNRQDGTFGDQSLMRGVAVNRHGRAEASMGIAVADVNRDDELDLLLTHITLENNTLYMGQEQLPFSDVSVESRMSEHDLRYTGFGCGFFDIEHDGDLDLAVANGEVRELTSDERAYDSFWERYAQPNLLFLNDGAGNFTPSPAAAGAFAAHIELSRGLAFADLDHDGDLDLVQSNGDNSLRVFRNDAPAPGAHWLIVHALTGPRDAIGALVTVVAENGQRWMAPILSGYSYQTSNPARAHFGLGSSTDLDYIEVRWPDGSRERFEAPAADSEVFLRQHEGLRR
jgi:hypothetical protein